MGIKGDGRGAAAEVLRQIAAGIEERLMTQMYTVEESQRIDVFFVFHIN